MTRPLNPASSRLLSVPPRYYDIIDGDTEAVVDSDLGARLARSRSLARSRGSELRDGWRHPGYADLVVGSRAHPGHRFPRWGHLSVKRAECRHPLFIPYRSSTEFCRDIMITSRSPSPVPQTINNFNKDMIAETEEKIHTSRMKTMYLICFNIFDLNCNNIQVS